jgi:hypothetical protein
LSCRSKPGLAANHLVNDVAILVEDVLAVVVCLRHLKQERLTVL